MDQGTATVEAPEPKRRFLRESPFWQKKAYDDTRAASPTVVALLHSYDPQLFLRYNRMFVRWELWCFKSRLVITDVTKLFPEEIVHRAGHVCDIVKDDKYVEPDERLLAVVKAADWWAKYSSGKDAAAAITAADIDAEKRQKLTDQEAFLDIAIDNKRQIREYFGSSSPQFFFYRKPEKTT